MICAHCKIAYEPSERELEELGIKREQLREGNLFKGTGCARCYHSGYKGRHGIYELMLVGSPIKRQLMKSADALELQKTAIVAGMSSLRQDGAFLAMDGVTSTAEVLRVARSCEDI